MSNVLATLGMAHSGTNLLKNMFNYLFNEQNKYPYRYTYCGHAETKNNHLRMNVNTLDSRGELLTVIFNYRNEFDRELSSIIRRHFKDKKGADEPSSKIDISQYQNDVADIVTDLLNDRNKLSFIYNKYLRILEIKKELEDKCNSLGTTCTVMPYEGFYENFDYIFDKLLRFNIKVSKNDIAVVKKRFSANHNYRISRSGSKTDVMNKFGLLSNHVSHTKGEPYFWTKFINLNTLLLSTSEENKTMFLQLIKNHPHINLQKAFSNGS